MIRGLDVGLEAELAQRRARRRADRDEPRAVESVPAAAWKKRADEAEVNVA